MVENQNNVRSLLRCCYKLGFYHISKHRWRALKTKFTAKYLWNLQGVLKCGRMLSRVLNIFLLYSFCNNLLSLNCTIFCPKLHLFPGKFGWEMIRILAIRGWAKISMAITRRAWYFPYPNSATCSLYISYPYQVSDLISQNIRTVGMARLLIANCEFGYGKLNTGNFINVLSKKLAKKFLDTLTMQFFLAELRRSTVTIGTEPQACIPIENYANLSSWPHG